jgi:ABC-type oligopeptide transport system substrate-binding subunit
LLVRFKAAARRHPFGTWPATASIVQRRRRADPRHHEPRGRRSVDQVAEEVLGLLQHDMKNPPADESEEDWCVTLAFAVANEWKKFGIDVNVQQQQGGVFQTEYAAGNFQAGSYWNQTCAIGPDLWVRLEWWHERYVSPTGTPASFNRERFKDAEVSRIIDDMGKLTTSDPRNVQHGTELLKELVKEMPVIPMFGTSKFVPVNNTYWTNYPSKANYYEGPWWWWSNFKYVVARLKPTQS